MVNFYKALTAFASSVKKLPYFIFAVICLVLSFLGIMLKGSNPETHPDSNIQYASFSETNSPPCVFYFYIYALTPTSGPGEFDGSANLRIACGNSVSTTLWKSTNPSFIPGDYGLSKDSLPAGYYTVIANDGYSTDSVKFTIQGLHLSLETNPASSPSAEDGSLTATVNGGSGSFFLLLYSGPKDEDFVFDINTPPPFDYFLVNMSADSILDLNDLPANTYYVSFSDNGSAGSVESEFVIGPADQVGPVVICKDTSLYINEAGSPIFITAADIDNGSSDQSGIDTLYLDQYEFTCNNIGANTVTLTVVDNVGNSNTCTATVTLVDTLAPEAIAHEIGLLVALDSMGVGSLPVEEVDNGSHDGICLPPLPQIQVDQFGVAGSANGIMSNPGIDTMYLDQSSFDCEDVGIQTVSLTVVDSSGNSSSVSTQVLVLDTVAPAVVTKNITVYLDAAGQATITPDSINDGSTDACGIDSLALDITSFDCEDVGDQTVTLTVFDGNNNVNSATAIVTVVDSTYPNIVFPSNPTISPYNPDLDSLIRLWAEGIYATDNCDCDLADSLNLDLSGGWVTLPGKGSIPDTVEKFVDAWVQDCNGNATEETVAIRLLGSKIQIVNCLLEDWDIGLEPYAHALYLYNSPLDPDLSQGVDTEHQRFVWDQYGGELTILGDSAATIRGMVISKVDYSVRFNVLIDLSLPKNWQEWNSLGGTYHVPLDPDQADVSHAKHTGWRYWELGADSRLEGVGSIAGTLYLTQAPDPDSTPFGERYRVQEGDGANDKDDGKGLSGWFFYNGTVTYEGEELELNSQGDVNVDIVACDTTFEPPVISPFVTEVEMLVTTTANSESAVGLSWVSEVPFNQGHIAVERSFDGNIFQEVAIIDKNPSSRKQEEILFVDNELADVLKYYYRLKVVNADGSYFYTQTFEVLLSEVTEYDIDVFPNPASKGFVDVFILHPENQVHRFQLLDMQGRLVKENQVKVNQKSRIDLEHVLPGIYLLQVLNPEGEPRFFKLQVE